MIDARRPNILLHRTRTARTMTGKRLAYKSAAYDENVCRGEYIRFVNQLMHRMKMDGIHRMVDAALEIVE